MNLAQRRGERTFSNLLPYLDLDAEKGILWLKDGSAVRILSVCPKSILSATEEELQTIQTGLISAVNQLPEGMLLQCLLVREQTNETSDRAALNWKAAHAKPDEQVISDSEERLFGSKLEALRERWANSTLFQTRIYISLRATPEVKSSTFQKLGPFSFLTYGRKSKKARKPVATLLSELEQSSTALKLALEAQGFEVKETPPEEANDYLFRFFNPDRMVNAPIQLSSVNARSDLSDAIALTDLIETRKGLALGRSRLRIGSLKTLPESCQPGLMTEFSAETKPFVLVLTILVLSQTEERERLSRRQRLASGMAGGNRVRNISAESQLEDIEETLSAMISSGEKLFATSLHLLTVERDEESHSFQQLLDSAERIGSGCRWFEETVGAYPVFFGILPFAPTFITRPKRLLSSRLSDFLPVFGIGPGHTDASVIFETPYQSILGYSLFEKSPSGNTILIGSSGSGKSTLACGLILGMAAKGRAS